MRYKSFATKPPQAPVVEIPNANPPHPLNASTVTKYCSATQATSLINKVSTVAYNNKHE
ncbi:MAG: hypothetical protein WCG93_14015 [Paludibacter sp.]